MRRSATPSLSLESGTPSMSLASDRCAATSAPHSGPAAPVSVAVRVPPPRPPPPHLQSARAETLAGSVPSHFVQTHPQSCSVTHQAAHSPLSGLTRVPHCRPPRTSSEFHTAVQHLSIDHFSGISENTPRRLALYFKYFVHTLNGV